VIVCEKGGDMHKKVIIAVLLIIFFCGCDKIMPKKQVKPTEGPKDIQPPPISGELLAQVENWAIGVEDFKDTLDAIRIAFPDEPIEDVATKKAILNDLVTSEILAREAEAQGLDKDEDVIDALRAYRRTLLDQMIREKIVRNITVTDIEVENFYNDNKTRLREPEERKVREILVPTETQAKDILIRLLQGESFTALAKNYSTAPSRSKSGDLGYISAVDAEKKSRKFLDEVFTKEKGEHSGYFKTDDGYYIIKVEDIRGGKVKPLSDMRDDIKEYLRQEKFAKRINDTVSNTKKKLHVIINEHLLE